MAWEHFVIHLQGNNIHKKTHRQKGSVSLQAHMPLQLHGEASWGGQTDDTLSVCSSVLFLQPSSIVGYPHAHMHACAHTHTNLQMGTKEMSIRLWGSLMDTCMSGSWLPKPLYKTPLITDIMQWVLNLIKKKTRMSGYSLNKRPTG